MDRGSDERFYERFWEDRDYHLSYAFDSAVRDRYPAIRRVWGGLRVPRRVLDLGCGNGVLTYWMFANGFGHEVHGIDVSATGIAFAREAFARPGLTFDTMSADTDLAELGRFDVVVASHVLEHIDEPRKVLEQLHGVAEWYLFEVPLEDAAVTNAVWRLRGAERRDNPVGHVNFWTKPSFRELLRSAGMLVVRDHRYASAPFSPFNKPAKRVPEQALLKLAGVEAYGRLMSTHYAVLARAVPSQPSTRG